MATWHLAVHLLKALQKKVAMETINIVEFVVN
jgi:hypothetical protein